MILLWLAACGGLHSLDPGDDTGVDDTAADTDTADTADTSVPPSGVIGLVEFTRLQVACPACFDASSDLFVTATAAFHAPADGSWIAWLPPSGTCSHSALPVPLSTTTTDLGAWTYLQSGSHSVGLSRGVGQTGTIYQSQGLDDADYLRNASWDVSIPEASVLVQGGVHTTEGFDTIEPFEMLYVEPAAAFAALIPRTGQVFSWTPTGSGDFFVVLVDAYDPNTVAYLGSAICRGPDSGSMTVPASMLSGWPSGAYLGIGLYRYRHNLADTSEGTTLEAVSSSGVLGTGTLY